MPVSECTQSGQVVTCSVDPALLPAGGDPVVLTLTVVFDPSVPPGTYTNRAYVSTKDDTTVDPKCPPTEAAGTAAGGPGAVALGNADNNVDCEPTPLKGTTGLSVVKSIFELAGDGTPVDSDGTVDFGDSVMYTMAVTPTGDSTEKDVVVTDVVPAGMSVDLTQVGCLDDGPCAIAYDAATRTITWRVGDLMPGETASVYFIVTVDPAPVVAAGQTYERVMTNVAAARSTQTPATPSNEVTTKASATVLPHTGADLGPLALLGSLTLGFGGLLALIGRPRRRRSS